MNALMHSAQARTLVFAWFRHAREAQRRHRVFPVPVGLSSSAFSPCAANPVRQRGEEWVVDQPDDRRMHCEISLAPPAGLR